MPVTEGSSREPPLEGDPDWPIWNEGFVAGKQAGIRSVINATARRCSEATKASDMDRARRFADIHGALLEMYPETDG